MQNPTPILNVAQHKPFFQAGNGFGIGGGLHQKLGALPPQLMRTDLPCGERHIGQRWNHIHDTQQQHGCGGFSASWKTRTVRRSGHHGSRSTGQAATIEQAQPNEHHGLATRCRQLAQPGSSADGLASSSYTDRPVPGGPVGPV